MANLTVCPNCGKCYEAASEEAANEPTWTHRSARWCPTCEIEHSKASQAAIDAVLFQRWIDAGCPGDRPAAKATPQRDTRAAGWTPGWCPYD